MNKKLLIGSLVLSTFSFAASAAADQDKVCLELGMFAKSAMSNRHNGYNKRFIAQNISHTENLKERAYKQQVNDAAHALEKISGWSNIQAAAAAYKLQVMTQCIKEQWQL